MKYFLTSLLSSILLYSCSTDVSTATGGSGGSNTTGTNGTSVSSKKGIGLDETAGYNNTQLLALNVSWYYNWGLTTNANSTVQFVPMIFSSANMNNLNVCDTLLGFNEPDNVNQANMTVANALLAWPTVAGRSTIVGSPAVAGDPVNGTWLPAFMQSASRVDFITVHWYKGTDTAQFYSDMINIYNTYKKPIWVTEFAAQTVSQATTSPNAYSQQQVLQFMIAVCAWMNNQTFIQKYAWHDSKTGTSALFQSSGQLTSLGTSYSKL